MNLALQKNLIYSTDLLFGKFKVFSITRFYVRTTTTKQQQQQSHVVCDYEQCFNYH